jgi:PAS domain S-box-containing protein
MPKLEDSPFDSRLALEPALLASPKPLLKVGALQDAIFNSPNFSCIATDVQGLVQIFSVGAERMLGYKAADLVGKIRPTEIADAQEMLILAKALSMEFDTPISQGFEALTFKASRGIEDLHELTFICEDGAQLPAMVSVTALRDEQGKMIGYLFIATNNSARKQVQAEQALSDQRLRDLLSAKAAADKANLAKSEFLSSMSHELRSPLNAVLGFAQLMASENPPPTPAQKSSIEQILQAGWYLLRLINEILDLAMIESGKVTVSQEPMSLADLLEDCQAMIEPQAHERGISVIFSCYDDPFYIFADRTRVKQVLINLLSNAIKYNRDGGTVIVECTRVDSGRIRLSVTDTGEGLDQEQLAQLFQPFNRLGRENGNKEGTGIGLVVTKQLVELMDGSIGVESTVGVGSEFWFELVASTPPDAICGDRRVRKRLQLNVSEPDQASRQRTILYVEDNPANLSLVEQLIARRADLKLLSATDGNVGVQLARTAKPDVILMDINLPGISGYEALKILREDASMAHIPVMALSANAIPADIARALEAGFFRYLTKPIVVDKFMDAIDVALRHAQEHGSASELIH